MTRVETTAAKFAVKRIAPFFVSPFVPLTSIMALLVAAIHLYPLRKDVYVLACGHDGTSPLDSGHHSLAIHREGSWPTPIGTERGYMRLTDTKAFFDNSDHPERDWCSRFFANWTNSVASRGLVPESIVKTIGLAHRSCNRLASPQGIAQREQRKNMATVSQRDAHPMRN